MKTASTEASGSGMASAVAISARTPGSPAASCATIPASGSTAITSRPRARSAIVSSPVPAPRSTAVAIAAVPIAWSTAVAG